MSFDTGLLAATALAAMFTVALIASHRPEVAIGVAIPVLLWPLPITAGGLPLSLSITVLLITTAVLRWVRRPTPLGALPALALAATTLLVASNYLHEPPYNLDPSEARNSMLTLVANIWLLVAIAACAERPVPVIKGLAWGGMVFSTSALALGSLVGGRLSLDVLNPNSAGHAAALGVISAISAARMTGKRKWLLLSLPSLILVVQAQSRGGLVVLAVGVATMWVLTHSGRRRVIGIVLTVAAMLALWGPASQFTHDELLSSRDARFVESDSRITVLEIAWRNILDHPFGGVGYGRFLDYTQAGYGLALNTHNDWVRFAVEAGIPTLLVMLLLLARPIAWGGPAELRATLLAACVSLTFANVGADLRVTAPLWVTAGLLWGAHLRRPLQSGRSSVVGNLTVSAVDAERHIASRGRR